MKFPSRGHSHLHASLWNEKNHAATPGILTGVTLSLKHR